MTTNLHGLQIGQINCYDSAETISHDDNAIPANLIFEPRITTGASSYQLNSDESWIWFSIPCNPKCKQILAFRKKSCEFGCPVIKHFCPHHVEIKYVCLYRQLRSELQYIEFFLIRLTEFKTLYTVDQMIYGILTVSDQVKNNKINQDINKIFRWHRASSGWYQYDESSEVISGKVKNEPVNEGQLPKYWNKTPEIGL